MNRQQPISLGKCLLQGSSAYSEGGGRNSASPIFRNRILSRNDSLTVWLYHLLVAPQRVTASSVHAVRGIICTRGLGPRLYTRNGFAVCTSLFLQLCIICNMHANLQANHAHNEIPTSRSRSTRLCFKIRECEKHNEMTKLCRCHAKKHKQKQHELPCTTAPTTITLNLHYDC